MRKLLLFVLLYCAVTPVSAQTRYVTDQLEVPLRAGTSTRYKILRMVRSGTPVEILQNDTDNGYSKVRLDGNVQGWILNRYLMDEPVPRERLAKAEKALEPLQSENIELRRQLQQLAEQKAQTEADYDALKQENEKLSQELAQIHKTAANAVAIDERNKSLEQQMVDLEREFQLLQQENQSLSDANAQAWFLRGAGVLLLGGLIGLIIPRIRWQKRNTRWSEL